MANKWKKVPVRMSPFGTAGGNYILKNEEFLISYQPWDENEGHDIFEPLATILTGDDTKRDETALWDKKTNTWRILWGDWRKEYERLFPDFEKCLEFYEKMKPEWGATKWSTDY